MNKNLAYYYLKGAYKVKPATRYKDAVTECTEFDCSDVKDWNQVFLARLYLHGFLLSEKMPEPNENLYPHGGLPMCAPPPRPGDICAWPRYAVIVWDV